MRARQILHVDMDAFYASIEQRDDPALAGRPLVVGGGSNRGVVAAASYEARRFGIRSAMPMREARRRCPELLRVAPRMSLYREVSEQVFEIFREYTPEVEGLSLDEAFLDVTGSVALFGPAADIAAAIKSAIRERTELTASVGVAPNKLVAKIASDLDKPDGLVVVTDASLTAMLDPLPAQVIPGIGRRTLERLHALGIRTLADLRQAPDGDLRRAFGRFAGHMRERASGHDERPVVADRAGKSLSAEETYDTDLHDSRDIRRQLLKLCERTSARLRAKELAAGRLTLKIRQADFRTFTRQRALSPPANDTGSLHDAALALLCIWLAENPGTGIRLLGVGGSEFLPAAQGDLFAAAGERPADRLDRAADDIRRRFADIPVGRARGFDDDPVR